MPCHIMGVSIVMGVPQGPKAWMMYKKVTNLYWNFPQIDDLGVPSL
jgi:hypothetical protein